MYIFLLPVNIPYYKFDISHVKFSTKYLRHIYTYTKEFLKTSVKKHTKNVHAMLPVLKDLM